MRLKRGSAKIAREVARSHAKRSNRRFALRLKAHVTAAKPLRRIAIAVLKGTGRRELGEVLRGFLEMAAEEKIRVMGHLSPLRKRCHLAGDRFLSCAVGRAPHQIGYTFSECFSDLLDDLLSSSGVK